MANSKVAILLELQQNIDKEIEKARKKMGDFNEGMKDVEKKSSSVTKGFSSMTKSVLATAAAYASLKTAQAVLGFANQAADNEQLTQSFVNLTNAVGGSAEKLLGDLRQAAAGTVNDIELMNAANQALLLGIDADAIPTMMKSARISARATEQDVSQAFADIVTGIGRGSKLILDNLGIIVDLNVAYETYAKELGKTAEKLTDQEKKQAFTNETMRKAEENMKAIGDASLTNSERIQALTSILQNFKAGLQRQVLPAIHAVLQGFMTMRQGLSSLANAWNNNWGSMRSIVEDVFNTYLNTIIPLNEKFVEMLRLAVHAIRLAYENNFLGIRDIVVNSWKFIFNATKMIVEPLVDIVTIVLKAITGDWEGALNGLYDFNANVWNNVLRTFQSAAKIGQGIFNSFIGAVNAGLRAVGSEMQVQQTDWADHLDMFLIDTEQSTRKMSLEWKGLGDTLDGFVANGGQRAMQIASDNEEISESAKKAADEAKKNLEKLESTYEGVSSGIEENLQSLIEKHVDFQSKTKESIKGVKEQIEDLNNSFSEFEGDRRTSIGEEFVRQQEKINEITESIAQKRKDINDRLSQDSGADVSSLNLDITELESQLQKEQEALSSHKDLQLQFQEEIEQAKQRASLTDFERRVMDLQDEIDKERIKTETRRTELEQRLADYEESLISEQEKFEEQQAFIMEIKQKAAEEEIALRKEVDKVANDLFLKELNRLKQLEIQAKKARQAGASVGGGGARFANGGMVFGPTNALIGERGPEMVLPLNAIVNGFGGGNKTTNIVINNPVVQDQIGVDSLISQIKEALGRDQELSQLGINV